MKKTKFLSLLVLAPLMTGCGNNVKAPKFADYGKKISYEKFIEALTKYQTESSLYKTAKIDSFEYTLKTVSLETYVITRGDTKVEDDSTYSETKGKGGYSKENLVIDGEFTSKTTLLEKSNEGKYSGEETTTSSSSVQSAKVGKGSYIVLVNNKEKTYAPQSVIDKDHKEADLMDANAKSTAISLGAPVESVIMIYEMYKYFGVDVSKSAFYQNGKVYTIDFKAKYEEDQKVAEEVIYTNTEEMNWTVQIDTTEGNWAVKYFMESTETREVKKTYSQFVEGDKYVSKTVGSYEVIMKTKEHKAKAVKLDKYAALGFDAI